MALHAQTLLEVHNDKMKTHQSNVQKNRSDHTWYKILLDPKLSTVIPILWILIWSWKLIVVSKLYCLSYIASLTNRVQVFGTWESIISQIFIFIFPKETTAQPAKNKGDFLLLSGLLNHKKLFQIPSSSNFGFPIFFIIIPFERIFLHFSPGSLNHQFHILL